MRVTLLAMRKNQQPIRLSQACRAVGEPCHDLQHKGILTMSHPAYDELAATLQRLHHFGHLQAIASWDRRP